MTDIRVIINDSLAALAELSANSIDAVVTDPPYGQECMGNGWDKFTPEAFQQFSQAWATEALRVLKPGGHLLAFGGTRTAHRLACGIEDAGFEMRDTITWMYGQGFPKSLDVGKAIDKATDDACRWQGWGTALKPASEPIIMARKSFAGTVAANVLTYGAGALNIDACRVGSPEDKRAAGTKTYQRFDPGSVGKGLQAAPHDGLARWPANVVLSHADSCFDPDGCAPGCPIAELDAQSGIKCNGGQNVTSTKPNRGMFFDGRPPTRYAGDSGGASRFFPTFRYQAKAPRRERPKVDGIVHPTVKPLELIRWLVRLVTPEGGTVLDPFAGSGTTGEACALEGVRCILIEREEKYFPFIDQRLARVGLAKR